ncbi:hypothetical protein J2S07_002205 [Robertmurraya andreesenii]|uniref:YlbE-like protein n=2 Tax=Anoxybacillus andreesenii TaxID=1325932 RepID=A0ABT9V4K7_9BACL|nr:hypothetical protein [Robertmurraya andreesenii]
MDYIRANPDLIKFLREQPIWYRKLSRNPNEFETFQIAAMHYYRKTIPHQVEKFSNGVQMASMMMGMFQAMNSNQT